MGCCLFVGCATDRGDVEKRLMGEKFAAQDTREISRLYLVGCPDLLNVRIDGYPDLDGEYIVEPDGRIQLGDLGDLRVEGKSLPDVVHMIAEEANVPADRVHLEVGEYRSQFVVLFGQVIGWQRVVPYQGQETVISLLRRVGGITRGASPENVYVVRTNVGNGKRPEAYRVDLEAIVIKGDDETNIRLEPFDQIYVGETKQSRLERCIPPWIRPVYQTLWDTRPDAAEAKEARQEHFRRISIKGRKSEPPGKGAADVPE